MKATDERKTANKHEVRRPLGHVNRARLNDEDRQERRRQLFKQSKAAKTEDTGIVIKGVQLNRRFNLWMKFRNNNTKGTQT